MSEKEAKVICIFEWRKLQVIRKILDRGKSEKEIIKQVIDTTKSF